MGTVFSRTTQWWEESFRIRNIKIVNVNEPQTLKYRLFRPLGLLWETLNKRCDNIQLSRWKIKGCSESVVSTTTSLLQLKVMLLKTVKGNQTLCWNPPNCSVGDHQSLALILWVVCITTPQPKNVDYSRFNCTATCRRPIRLAVRCAGESCLSSWRALFALCSWIKMQSTWRTMAPT